MLTFSHAIAIQTPCPLTSLCASHDVAEEHEVFKMTSPEHWEEVKFQRRTSRKRARGKARRRRKGQPRRIDPIQCSGECEEFCVEISEEDLAELRDSSEVIRFSRVFDWLLPRFDGKSFYAFVAARMRNYMSHIVRTEGFKPAYFSVNNVVPADDVTVQEDHVRRFFGCQMGRMAQGMPSIRDTWSTRDSLDSVPPVMDSMPRGAFEDMYRCLHFADDWEEENWEEVHPDPKSEPSPDVANHRRKFATVEDGFNARWKECVTFGRWITADESRVAGWYHSGITIGPEPKPIRTGATIHSVCVTFGELKSYKVSQNEMLLYVAILKNVIDLPNPSCMSGCMEANSTKT